IPVARNAWRPTRVESPAATALLLIMSRALFLRTALSVSVPVSPLAERESGSFSRHVDDPHAARPETPLDVEVADPDAGLQVVAHRWPSPGGQRVDRVSMIPARVGRVAADADTGVVGGPSSSVTCRIGGRRADSVTSEPGDGPVAVCRGPVNLTRVRQWPSPY